MKAVALVDGQHYIPVTKAALQYLRETEGYDIVATVFIGGMEKIGDKEDIAKLEVPAILDDDPMAGLAQALDIYKPDVVVDLSDEPVVGYKERFQFANLILNRGIVYAGADFTFRPPRLADVITKPSVAFVGTGKRIGKTAVCAYGARVLAKTYNPCIVTMGRGGSAEPEVIRGDQIELTPQALVDIAKQGKHAASDHFEDAIMARLTTIGSRRCGGGFAGVVYYSNVVESAQVADGLGNDMILFEGSGASIPPVKADGYVLIVGANQPVEYIASYMGPYRVLLADLVMLTLCEEPLADQAKIDAMVAALKGIKPDVTVITSVFRPKPLGDIRGKRVVYTTTAPASMGQVLKEYLEETYGCTVVGVSHKLSNRPQLRRELDAIYGEQGPIDVLLTEVKAASIDVAAAYGLERGTEVVFCDNIPVCLDPDVDLPEAIAQVGRVAVTRHNAKA